MKTITLFYQKRCPFCVKALKYIEALQQQEVYKSIPIEMIDEIEQPELADSFDYYYVPTFYIGKEKLHEGGIFPAEVEDLLKKALD